MREDLIIPPINRWISSLFDPIHRDETIAVLLKDDSADQLSERTETLLNRVAAAETVMKKLRKALEVGGIRPSFASSTTQRWRRSGLPKPR